MRKRRLARGGVCYMPCHLSLPIDRSQQHVPLSSVPFSPMTLSEHHDLRTGNPAWDEEGYEIPLSSLTPRRCDVAIIGAGIMGAILAERLSAEGHKVALLDRRPPAHGSTAASTAQIMWAMDVPLRDLALSIGEAEARRRWQRIYRVTRALAALIDDLAIA